MGIENRRHERVDLDLPVRITAGDLAVEGRVENLGPEGTFVRLADPHSLPARVKVILNLENCLLPIEIGCEVKWRRGGEVPGVGLYFETVPIFEKAAIADFIYRVILEQKDWLEQNE